MRRAFAAAAAFTLVLGGCSGGGDPGSGGWESLLEVVPDVPETRRHIVLHDYALLRDRLGLERPASDADGRVLAQYAMALTRGPVTDETTSPVTRSPLVFATMESFDAGAALDLEEWASDWETAFGFSFVDADQDIVAGLRQDRVVVWHGDISGDEVSDAVTSDPQWSDDLRTRTAGRDYWCWTDDPGRPVPDRRSMARPLGDAGCLAALGGGTVVRTTSDEPMQLTLGAVEDGQPSLADVDEIRSIVAVMVEEGAYAAFVTTETDRFESELDSGTFVDRYETLGLGAAVDDEGDGLLIVVFVFADEATATENGVTFRTIIEEGSPAMRPTPWSELLTIRDARIDGPMLVVVMEGEGFAPRYWIEAPMTRETLILWE